MPSNMDSGSEDIDRQLNKVKIFQCLSVHIHAYKIRILGGTERRWYGVYLFSISVHFT